MDTKAWYKSKEFVANLIAFLIAVSTLTQFTDVVPEGAIKYVLLVVAVLNLALRFFFPAAPITGSPAAKKAEQ